MAQDTDDFQTQAVFKALADPTRRRILRDLKKAPLPAGDIASHFPISGPSVSRHLAVLKAAGLVTERRQANKVIYSLAPERLAVTVGSFLRRGVPRPVAAPSAKKEEQDGRQGRGEGEGQGACSRPFGPHGSRGSPRRRPGKSDASSGQYRLGGTKLDGRT